MVTVRWRHRTDCEFLHHRGHHSIYAGPYGGDTERSVHRHSLNIIRRILYEGTIKSLRRTVHFYDDDYGMKD